MLNKTMDVLHKINSLSFTNEFIKSKENVYNTLYGDIVRNDVKQKICIQKEDIHKEDDCITHNNKFWFIFIMVHGIDEYELLKKKATIESKLRYNLIDVLQEKDNKSMLKIYKFKINEIINDLGNIGNIEMDTFKALCLYYKMNYCLTHKKLCEIKKHNDSDSYFIIQDNKMFLQEKTLNDIKDQYYIVHNINKPFKSVSSYKLCELKDMCLTLDILSLDEKEGTIKLKKKDYYTKIIEYCN